VDVMISTNDNKGLPVSTNLVLFTSLSGSDNKEDDKVYPKAGFLGQELKQIYFTDNDLIINTSSDKKILDLVLLCTPDLIQNSPGESTLSYLPELMG